MILVLPGFIWLNVACQPGGQSSVRPNIIFIFSDDHAQKAIGAYRGSLVETPNLDRLAEEGMIFTNSFVTNSICSPSRAVVLTGKFSHLNGMKTNMGKPFDGSQQTLPKILQEAGYETAIIGKWHLKSDPTGFDHWDVLPGQGVYYDPTFLTPAGKEDTKGYVTDVITDKVLRWLSGQRSKEKPFMLMYHHKAPHRAWWPDPKYFDLYADTEFPEPRTLYDQFEGKGQAAKMATMRIQDHLSMHQDLKFLPDKEKLDSAQKILSDPNFAQLLIPVKQFAWQTTGMVRNYNLLSPGNKAKFDSIYGKENQAYLTARMDEKEQLQWKYQRYIKDYLRSVRSIDDNLGRLMDQLEQSGLAENTIVIYASDQGFYLGEHGWFDKRFMYEESLRTPLIIKWPGVVPGPSQSAMMVQNIDYAQTILEMAGIEPPADMQGTSLVPLLKGELVDNWRQEIYYHYYEYPGWHDVPRHYGVRTQQFKLIHFYELGEWELYNLQNDPSEMINLYGGPGMDSIQDVLKTKIKELQVKYQVEEGNEEHF